MTNGNIRGWDTNWLRTCPLDNKLECAKVVDNAVKLEFPEKLLDELLHKRSKC